MLYMYTYIRQHFYTINSIISIYPIIIYRHYSMKDSTDQNPDTNLEYLNNAVKEPFFETPINNNHRHITISKKVDECANDLLDKCLQQEDLIRELGRAEGKKHGIDIG